METSIYFCSKALLWSVVVLVACFICMAVDIYATRVPYRTSTLFILVPCAASMTYFALLKITDLQNKLTNMQRELEEVKGKQL